MQSQSSYKVHMNTISNGELSDPLCDSVNRGLTLVRLLLVRPSVHESVHQCSFLKCSLYFCSDLNFAVYHNLKHT